MEAKMRPLSLLFLGCGRLCFTVPSLGGLLVLRGWPPGPPSEADRLALGIKPAMKISIF